MPATSRAGENPYTAPPRPAATRLAPHRRSTQNKLAAEPAKPAVSRMVRLVCGPASSVTGASRIPGSRTDVFHIRLMPCGAFSPVVTRAGSRPCETAVALYRMNQANRLMSPGLPATIRPAGSAHSRQVSAREASRYSPTTSHPAQLAVRRPGAGAGVADSSGTDWPCSLVTLLTPPKHRGGFGGRKRMSVGWDEPRTGNALATRVALARTRSSSGGT